MLKESGLRVDKPRIPSDERHVLRSECNVGELPVFVLGDFDLFLQMVMNMDYVDMDATTVHELQQGAMIYTLGAASCLAGVKFFDGNYCAFHSQGRSVPREVFETGEGYEGIVVTGSEENYSLFEQRLHRAGMRLVMPPRYVDRNDWKVAEEAGANMSASVAVLRRDFMLNNIVFPQGIYVGFEYGELSER